MIASDVTRRSKLQVMIFCKRTKNFSLNDQELSFKAWHFRRAVTDIEWELEFIFFLCPLIEKLSYISLDQGSISFTTVKEAC